MMESLVRYTGLSAESLGICSFALAILGLLGIVSSATKPKQAIRPSERLNKNKKKRHFHGKHEFVHRPSLLDTGMAIVVPWRKDGTRSKVMKKSVFRGWYNLLWIAGSAWLLQYFMNNWKTKGSLIGNLNWFLSLFHFLHELLIMLLPIYSLSFSAFLLEKLRSMEVFGKKYTRIILHSIQHTIQTVMIFGMYIITVSSAVND